MTPNELSDQKHELVELYSNYTEEGNFAIGYILDINDQFIVFESISEIGMFDAIQIRRISSITQVIKQSDYLKLFSFMINENRKNNLFDAYQLTSPNYSNQLSLTNILQIQYESGNIISIISDDFEDVLTGRIIDLTESAVRLVQFDFGSGLMIDEIEVQIDTITVLDLVSVENHLISKFAEKR